MRRGTGAQVYRSVQSQKRVRRPHSTLDPPLSPRAKIARTSATPTPASTSTGAPGPSGTFAYGSSWSSGVAPYEQASSNTGGPSTATGNGTSTANLPVVSPPPGDEQNMRPPPDGVMPGEWDSATKTLMELLRGQPSTGASDGSAPVASSAQPASAEENGAAPPAGWPSLDSAHSAVGLDSAKPDLSADQQAALQAHITFLASQIADFGAYGEGDVDMEDEGDMEEEELEEEEEERVREEEEEEAATGSAMNVHRVGRQDVLDPSVGEGVGSAVPAVPEEEEEDDDEEEELEMVEIEVPARTV
jgi:hypothetical protein